MRDAVLALLTWAKEERGVRDVVTRVLKTNSKSLSIIESMADFKRVDGETEIDWPQSKGGGKRISWTFRLGDTSRNQLVTTPNNISDDSS
jgi:hypothetical protein